MSGNDSITSAQRRQEQLQYLISQGLTFSDCVRAFGVSRESDPIASKAYDIHHHEGTCEIDDTTVLSESDEGSYVMAWVWVDYSPSGNDEDEE